jgi:hypothetical protein
MPDPDNHIDELFRKAAEHYRPKPADSDWDKIASQIASDTTVRATIVDAPAGTSKYQFKRILLLMILLLVLPYAIISVIVRSNKENSTQTVPVSTNRNNSEGQENVSVEKKDAALDDLLNFQPPSSINTTQSESIVIESNITRKNSLLSTTLDVRQPAILVPLKEVSNVSNLINIAPITTNNDAIAEADESLVNAIIQLKADSVARNYETSINAVSDELTVNDTTRKETLITPKKTDVKKKASQNGFYIGLVAGVELNGVKELNIEKVGYKLGVIGGYRFSRRVSVESGLLYNKKNYNADGQYFNMDEISPDMPEGMKVISLKGSCNIVELPLNLNYQFTNGLSNNFYFSGGFSSYLLSKEVNLYNTILNGLPVTVKGDYRQTSTYIAATLNLGLGYEKTFKSGSIFRINPYLQLPIGGIGVGQLQVMSAGIHAGFRLFTKQ